MGACHRRSVKPGSEAPHMIFAHGVPAARSIVTKPTTRSISARHRARPRGFDPPGPSTAPHWGGKSGTHSRAYSGRGARVNLQARSILKERENLGKEAHVEVARELAAADGTSASNAASVLPPTATALCSSRTITSSA
jgi:hypothetical protein